MNKMDNVLHKSICNPLKNKYVKYEIYKILYEQNAQNTVDIQYIFVK